ncbi:Hypothetical protein A7982_09012 [Minicystis rosea]|nr:Hypothetical protein A7982_09012 [Minicystis rosea]
MTAEIHHRLIGGPDGPRKAATRRRRASRPLDPSRENAEPRPALRSPSLDGRPLTSARRTDRRFRRTDPPALSRRSPGHVVRVARPCRAGCPIVSYRLPVPSHRSPVVAHRSPVAAHSAHDRVVQAP